MSMIRDTHVTAGRTASFFSRLRDTVLLRAASFKARRDLRRISELDDHVLADIGLSRAEIHEAQLGLHAVDPMTFLLQANRSR